MKCHPNMKQFAKKNKRIGGVMKNINKKTFAKKFHAFKKTFAKNRSIKNANFEHIGSTTVHGILAKPILDVMYVTNDTPKNHVQEFASNDTFDKCLHIDNTWSIISRKDTNLHIVRNKSKKYNTIMKFKGLLKNKTIRDEYIELKRQNKNAKNSEYKNDFFAKYKL
jgi:GrpB-like predicted nucleotidyltransferase (UPF0157 family)